MRPLSLLIAGWMCVSMSGLSCAVTPCTRTHLEAPVIVTDSYVSRPLLTDTCDDISSVTVEVRGALTKVKERAGMSKNCWGVSLIAPGDTVDIALRFGNTDFGDMLDRRIAVISVTRGGEQLHSMEVSGFRMSSNEFNSLTAVISAEGLELSGGGEQSRHVLDVGLDGFMPAEARVWSVGEMSVTQLSTECCRKPETALSSGYTYESLQERFQSSHDALEGFWTYFDRSNDPMYARLGGQYTLAIVKRDRSGGDGFTFEDYDIIYISGARTLADSWQPMMLKGALRSTIFDGHYDLEWIDSTMERITDDIHATVESGSLLTLSFPLYKTTIRFSKHPHASLADYSGE